METQLLELMAEILETEAEELTLETEFKVEKYDWDSLKGYAILVMLEEEFGVDMPVEEFIQAKKIIDIYSCIQKNRNETV